MIEKSKIKNQKSKQSISTNFYKFPLISILKFIEIHFVKFIEICCLWFVILIFTFYILHLNCYAQPISSSELINNAKQYDGKEVVYEGEVIGDMMVRAEFAWINVSDGRSAIGIWIDKDLLKDILYTGSYKSKGDWVSITGIFHRACSAHGGDLDIHATSLARIKSGELKQERIISTKHNLLIVLLGALCLILILRRLIIR